MTKEELLAILQDCINNRDTEEAHSVADGALIKFINDPDIAEAYDAVRKWYE